MKRYLLVAAAAHVLLLVLLYLDHAARRAAFATEREHDQRQQHERRHDEALAERRRELSATLPDAGAAAQLADAGPGPLEPGRQRRLARPAEVPGDDWRGASVAQIEDEASVLAELRSAHLVPARELVGQVERITWSFVDSWYTLGPLPLDAPAPSLTELDLDARYPDVLGATAGWRFLQSSRPELVPATMRSSSVHYAFTRLRSDRPRDVWLAFGADDSLQVWLDGKLIWDCGEHWRAWELDEGARRVTLREGESSLLIRLANWPTVTAWSVLIRSAPSQRS
ncbi:MAG: hypothetical protein RL685_5203, partial [Pseudomonadota bacterium]